MLETPLSKLMPGERGTVTRIGNVDGSVRRRLLEMGLIKGAPVELVRFAPMGDPIEVKVKGYRLSLRRDEAESVLVRKEVS
jgi:Fe2+ transport system protein FeoA